MINFTLDGLWNCTSFVKIRVREVLVAAGREVFLDSRAGAPHIMSRFIERGKPASLAT
jgi:hypothetical protein